jgi:hypothetical protein
VNLILGARFDVYKIASLAQQIAQGTHGGGGGVVLLTGSTNRACVAVEDAFGDAEEVEIVRGGMMVITLAFGIQSIDSEDQRVALVKGAQEITNPCGLVLASKANLGLRDAVGLESGAHSVAQEGDALGTVVDGKGSFENVPMTIDDDGAMLELGVVKRDNGDLIETGSRIEKSR